MTLTNYFPTFRNVLLEVVELTQTKSGLYIPSTINRQPHEREYKVIKTGSDCLVVQPGDTVKIMPSSLMEVTLDHKVYLQILEQQIIGYERDDDTRTTYTGQSASTDSIQLS